ncbi:MAG: hypothetical protein WCY56_03975 [Aminobacteriaceae bacterium]
MFRGLELGNLADKKDDSYGSLRLEDVDPVAMADEIYTFVSYESIMDGLTMP